MLLLGRYRATHTVNIFIIRSVMTPKTWLSCSQRKYAIFWCALYFDIQEKTSCIDITNVKKISLFMGEYKWKLTFEQLLETVLKIVQRFKMGDKILKRINRLEICQKIYTTRFSGQKFYTLKVRKLRLFLLKINSVNSLISVILVASLLEFNWLCKILTVSVQNLTWCVKIL